MEPLQKKKLIQADDGSMDTPPCVNNAKTKEVKKATGKLSNEEVTITQKIIHQNSL